MADEVQVNDTAGLLAAVGDISRKFGHTEFWWRGHSKSTWELVPGAFRNNRGHSDEVNRIERFRLKARTRYANCPLSDDIPSWLFLMQHYGLETRLLDWTESPLVAAFFAVKEYPTFDATLWALDPFNFNLIQTESRLMYTQYDEPARSLLREAIIWNDNKKGSELVVAIAPSEIDIRMLIQLSFFTVHGSPQPLETLKNLEDVLSKITIPASAKPKIIAELELLGIRMDSLFPDLEHLVEHIKTVA